MTRDPLVDKKLAMKERLPDLCRILKAYPTLILIVIQDDFAKKTKIWFCLN